MIESQILYRIFTRFATALGVLNGLSLDKAKALTRSQLEKHSGKAASLLTWDPECVKHLERTVASASCSAIR